MKKIIAITAVLVGIIGAAGSASAAVKGGDPCAKSHYQCTPLCHHC